MSIIEQAKIELAAVNFGEEDSRVMIGLLEKFLSQWDSGGAVNIAGQVFARLLSGQPLGPLTGADEEWHDPMGDGSMLQNIRCSTVFKDWRDAKTLQPCAPHTEGSILLVHDIEAPEPFAPILFPYNPPTRLPPVPMIVVG